MNFNGNIELLTDLYQLTMAYGYWKAGLDQKEAVFHLTFRKLPFQGGFAVAAGLEQVIDFIRSFRFRPEDFSYLGTLKGVDEQPLFTPDFFDYLKDFRFTCDIDAVPEGTVIFPHEPLIRVKGPLIQCQLLESPLLNLINFPTLVATKAARIAIAADGDPVLEFGLRRAQGVDGALTASRAAYIGGCDATSNVLAGQRFGIPVKGTHSHSWVMVFEEEIDSFQEFCKWLPGNTILLVDTYRTLDGVKKAIQVGLKLKAEGKKLVGIRLDSGDLAYLSIESRRMLDEAGLTETKILASNELDEVIISALKRQGARIDIWGVGTNLVTAKEQAALDGVYKLSAIRNPGESWEYKVKLSEQMIKMSNPGILQIRRFKMNGENIADAIFNEEEPSTKGYVLVDPLDPTRQKTMPPQVTYEDLLLPIFRKGEVVYQIPSLSSVRQRTKEQLNQFHAGIKRFIYPHEYIVGLEKGLYDCKIELIKNIRNQFTT